MGEGWKSGKIVEIRGEAKEEAAVNRGDIRAPTSVVKE